MTRNNLFLIISYSKTSSSSSAAFNFLWLITLQTDYHLHHLPLLLLHWSYLVRAFGGASSLNQRRTSSISGLFSVPPNAFNLWIKSSGSGNLFMVWTGWRACQPFLDFFLSVSISCISVTNYNTLRIQIVLPRVTFFLDIHHLVWSSCYRSSSPTPQRQQQPS